MMEAVQFLSNLGQALATMALYSPGHPARERAVDLAYQALLDLQARTPSPVFTFLGGEAIFGRQPLRELKEWEWGVRLSDVGIDRLEFQSRIDREEFVQFLDELLGRMFLAAPASSEARSLRPSGVRFGSVGVKSETEVAELPTASVNYSLGDEAEAIRWLHQEVQDRDVLHLAEAETVVRSLSVAMHSQRQMMIPLLKLQAYDQYTTTHALNVAVLAMAVTEFLKLHPRDIQAFGVAGLLHDIGKTRVPYDILMKPGRLTESERAIMNRHPVDGARIIIETEEDLDLAAVVAYEHHIMIDGGGYPGFRFRRDCHYASRVIHVCDVYDALRTDRPYRPAWSGPRVLDYIAERVGTEFDAEIAPVFLDMMRTWEQQFAVATDERQALTPGAR